MKIKQIIKKNLQDTPPAELPRNVALVLSGGGARGFAHIGAIRELEQRGYRITSIAGTSIGALVGGFYAAGKLDEFTEWIISLKKKNIFNMMDFSLSMDHMMKGKRLMGKMKTILIGARIEALPIPFCAVATNITTGKEQLFRSGDLATAIRASISLPGLMRPVIIGEDIFVDGGVINQMPLNRVVRTEGDLLFGIDVSAPSEHNYDGLKNYNRHYSGGFLGEMRRRAYNIRSKAGQNYVSLGMRVSELAIQSNAALTKKLNPPDLLLEIPCDRYNTLEFDKAAEIIERGQQDMAAKLDEFEKNIINS